MSALAGRRFLKMNGLGNQIVVLDLRGTAINVSADEARAVAAHPRSPFDQLMIIHDPRGPGADAFIRIMNTDGSDAGACGKRHALCRLGLVRRSADQRRSRT